MSEFIGLVVELHAIAEMPPCTFLLSSCQAFHRILGRIPDVPDNKPGEFGWYLPMPVVIRLSLCFDPLKYCFRFEEFAVTELVDQGRGHHIPPVNLVSGFPDGN